MDSSKRAASASGKAEEGGGSTPRDAYGEDTNPFAAREEENPFSEDSFIQIQADQLAQWSPAPRNLSTQVPEVHFENVDPFARITECAPEELEKLAEILELRGAQPRQGRMRQACFEAAELAPGVRVRDVGCGTGVVTRRLARVVGRKGRVVGVDPSAPLLDYARRCLVPGAPIEYVVGDAFDLRFPDGAFDASVSVPLFSHITRPGEVVRQMIKVTRSGGKIMLLDQDYQTLVFEHSDKKLTRKILLHGSDYNVLDPWCGRSLTGLLVQEGVVGVRCWPFVYAERDSQSYLITIAQRFAALAVHQQAVSEDEARAWLNELYTRAIEGTFYASLNYYFSFGEVR